MEFDLDQAIRKIPDFPHKGVLYYDITSILTNIEAFGYCLDRMGEIYRGRKFVAVAGIEARGFIFASAYALRYELPLILARKAGKLPGETVKKSYTLEYGEEKVEMHKADIPGEGEVLLVDDLLATGGTAAAATEIVKTGGARVTDIFGVIGLPFLGYKEKNPGVTITTLIDYESE